MQVTEDRDGDTLILALDGRLDSTTSPEFEKKIVGAIRDNQKHIVIDMGGVEYISSAGLRAVLIGAKRSFTGAGSTRFSRSCRAATRRWRRSPRDGPAGAASGTHPEDDRAGAM